MSDGPPVGEAPLETTEVGLVPAGDGWFVLNAREARWTERPGRGHALPFTGWHEDEEAYFPQLGVNLFVLGPGEPIGMYHWEADHEDFLVLSGEAVLIVEGEERSLRDWDFIHLPPGTRHMVIGAGANGCTVLAIGAREHGDQNVNGGAYVVDDVAARHGVGVEEETSDPAVAYARFPNPRPTRYRDGWLPFGS